MRGRPAGSIGRVVLTLGALAFAGAATADDRPIAPAPNATNPVASGEASASFKCYRVEPEEPAPRFESRTATLTDQLGSAVATIREPRTLCNPATVNGRPTVGRVQPLVCYHIEHADPGQKRRKLPRPVVRVSHQFGDQALELTGPKALCTTAATDQGSLPAQPERFKCYSVEAAKGTRDIRAAVVAVVDELGASNATVMKPGVLCLPLSDSETRTQVEVGGSALACYKLKDAGTKKPPRTAVNRKTEFGTARLGLKETKKMCVPAQVTVLPNPAEPPQAAPQAPPSKGAPR